MKKILLGLLLVFTPFTVIFAQSDSGGSSYDDSSGYSSDGYDDGDYSDGDYSDDDYSDDGYYDDEYYDDGYDDQDFLNMSENGSSGPKFVRVGLILRGGWQGSLEKTFKSGGVFETMLNFDVYYVYFQAGIGWSSFWSRLGVEKANAGGAGSSRSGTAFNEGMYFGLGFGVVVPQIGLRVGGGIQTSFALLSHGFNIEYSDEILPYVEVAYELAIVENLSWTVSMRSLLSGARFSPYLPSTGRKATIELQTGFVFNFF